MGSLTSLRVCYEAGPTGYGLQRFLAAAGVDCIVVAPSLIPETNSRVKTDRRDACKLARFLRSGDLTSIWISDEQTEALRDLERARDDARLAERRIKQQLLKFLLRHSRVFTAGKALWTKHTGRGFVDKSSNTKPSRACSQMRFKQRRKPPSGLHV